MAEDITVRLAKEEDLKDVLAISEGIYDGRDYLPLVFHRWLKMPDKYVFVAELGGKIIGLLAMTVIDGEKTLLGQGLRILQEYRSRWYSYKIISAVIESVCNIRPEVSKIRYQTEISKKEMNAFAKRMGYKSVAEHDLLQLQFIKPCIPFLRLAQNEHKVLHELRKTDADELILRKTDFNSILPQKIILVNYKPYDVIESNIDFIFKEGDKIFVDLSAQELRRQMTPRSVSHGRLAPQVNTQSWICSVYAEDRDAFKSHVIRQLMSAVEAIGGEFAFDVFHARVFNFDAKEVLIEVVGTEQRDLVQNDISLVYEKQFRKSKM